MMNDKNYKGEGSLLFIDFKEAFDSINHEILVKRIE